MQGVRGNYRVKGFKRHRFQVPNDSTGEYDEIPGAVLCVVEHVPSGGQCAMIGFDAENPSEYDAKRVRLGEETLDYAERIEKAGRWGWQTGHQNVDHWNDGRPE